LTMILGYSDAYGYKFIFDDARLTGNHTSQVPYPFSRGNSRLPARAALTVTLLLSPWALGHHLADCLLHLLGFSDATSLASEDEESRLQARTLPNGSLVVLAHLGTLRCRDFWRFSSSMPTTAGILHYAALLEEISPGFLVTVILVETGEDYRDRDLLSQVLRLIELFGVVGAAEIVGCP
jgi:hypothetical protein